MDPNAVRKRPGRPKKMTTTTAEDNLSNSAGLVHTVGGAGALVAISPIPEDQSNSSGGSAAECRRSSRKKIIKFDVRDLLNKHRKPHKIQIEARIDSNAPSSSTKSQTSNATNIAPSSKEKCFIEKTTIIQRNTTTERQQYSDTKLPIQLAPEIFKPKQSSSLIVAQMQSTISASTTAATQKSFSEAKNIQVIEKVINAHEKNNATVKKRGRPPKNRSISEKHNDQQSSQDDDTKSASNVSEIQQAATGVAAVSLRQAYEATPAELLQENQKVDDFILEISSSGSANDYNDVTYLQQTPPQHRSFATVSFLRDTSDHSVDEKTEAEFIVAAVEEITAEDQIETKTESVVLEYQAKQHNLAKSPAEIMPTIEVTATPKESPSVDIVESNTTTFNYDAEASVSPNFQMKETNQGIGLEVLETKHVGIDGGNNFSSQSESSKECVQLEMQSDELSQPELIPKQQLEDVKQHIKQQDKTVSVASVSTMSSSEFSHITLPLKKQLSKFKDLLLESCEEKPEEQSHHSGHTSTTVVSAASVDTIDSSGIEFTTVDSSTLDASKARKSATPIPRRNDRRSGRSLNDGSNNKTLEETFAEIAASSCKEILDLAVGKADTAPNAEKDQQKDELVKNVQIEETNSATTIETLSVAPPNIDEEALQIKESIIESAKDVVQPAKKRGRKPKNFPIETAASKQLGNLSDTSATGLQVNDTITDSVEKTTVNTTKDFDKDDSKTLINFEKEKPVIPIIPMEEVGDKFLSQTEVAVVSQSNVTTEFEPDSKFHKKVEPDKGELIALCKLPLDTNINTNEQTSTSKTHFSSSSSSSVHRSDKKSANSSTHKTSKKIKEHGKEAAFASPPSAHKKQHSKHFSTKSDKNSEKKSKSKERRKDKINIVSSTDTSNRETSCQSKKSVADQTTEKSKIKSDAILDTRNLKSEAATVTPKIDISSSENVETSHRVKASKLNVLSQRSEEKSSSHKSSKISSKLSKHKTPTKEEKHKEKKSKEKIPHAEHKEKTATTATTTSSTSSEKKRHKKKERSQKSSETSYSTPEAKPKSVTSDSLNATGTPTQIDSFAKSLSASSAESNNRKRKSKNFEAHLMGIESSTPIASSLHPLKLSRDSGKHKESKSSKSTSSPQVPLATAPVSKDESGKSEALAEKIDEKRERQRRLKEAFEAALCENGESKCEPWLTPLNLDCPPKTLISVDATTTSAVESSTRDCSRASSPCFELLDQCNEAKAATTILEQTETPPIALDIPLPPTPSEPDVSEAQSKPPSPPASSVANDVKPLPIAANPVDTASPDPLHDIEKFIEAGVNLLKRGYKIGEDDDSVENKGEVQSASISTGVATETAPAPTASSLPATVTEPNISTEISATVISISPPPPSMALNLYETPADTPATTPGSTPPRDCSSPTDTSIDTYYYSDGVRRSHRLKKITNAPKALVGRGLVRDRDRERLSLRDDGETKAHYSMEDHLMDLAEVEAKNAKFLKEMEERLSNFEVIKENEYFCERVVSREARKMICDCFLTPDEAERGELGCGEDCLNRLLMIECSAHCKVKERCTNKRFQKYLCAPCRVFRTEKKGFGIMADVEIHPGEFIMEYVGEVLDSDEFERRRDLYSQDKNRHYYFMALRSDAIIDATVKGNISRFINHSCDPNAETQKWTVNGELRIGFFSRKTIMPGEEITFDYQYQRYGREAQRCYCESANCRGWIGEEPTSDEGEQLEDDDDDYDEEEEDEDENDMATMVKGLMSVDDVEEDDDKDELTAKAAQYRKEQAIREAQLGAAKEDVESDESKRKFMEYLGKISAKIEMDKQMKREEKKRKRQQRKKAATDKRSSAPVSNRFLEDPDIEDEIDFLSRCGLKNQSDTLRLSRLMVRAKLPSTRLNLLSILREGELPCRRLFLDYHGLHLLHGWFSEDGRNDMTIRMALLETLDCLPIANKTILTDSKVFQAVRSWCPASTDSTAQTPTNAEGSSSSPSDDSSKESATGAPIEKPVASATTAALVPPENAEKPQTDLEKLAAKLLGLWENLPEIFRIPKRERIEQMKEHEREADRQYAATVEGQEIDEEQKELSTDRYQRDRFERRFGRPYSSRAITVVGAMGSMCSTVVKRSSGLEGLSPEDTKHLSKEQRRELFAAKVARDEAEKRLAKRRRELEIKCSFFGLDARLIRPEDLPFCVSDSGQWFNEQRVPIATPPAFAHIQPPPKPMSTNAADYHLPEEARTLPPEWGYGINEQGLIYYYHLRKRVPQWNPPTAEQINQTKWSDSESDSAEEGDDTSEEFSEEKLKELEGIETAEDLKAYLAKITQARRQERYKNLVDERPISPRREEDRIYNQMEMRKYKENKEKIKKRKEEIRRRRVEAIKNSTLNMCTLGSIEDPAIRAASISAAAATASEKNDEDTEDILAGALPIQDYLLSSDDDDETINEMKAECNNSPLLDKIVQGDKIVDELDALATKRQLKRPLPPHRDLSLDLASSSNSSTDILPLISEKTEHKKRKQERKEKSKRSKESGDAKYRKSKEKFRCEIAGIIVQHLKPYRKDSCTFGRIRSNEDFNHLAKKLTHFVMVKELKYCESVGQTLVVTESVKNKSREFIKKYMAKHERGYIKPNNDPEFKDIPFTL